eukprot:417730-Prorocentrum_minimum.AAC.1
MQGRPRAVGEAAPKGWCRTKQWGWPVGCGSCPLGGTFIQHRVAWLRAGVSAAAARELSPDYIWREGRRHDEGSWRVDGGASRSTSEERGATTAADARCQQVLCLAGGRR